MVDDTGVQANADIPAADWEALLERPLTEVRRSLGVDPVEDYEAVRSAGAPAAA